MFPGSVRRHHSITGAAPVHRIVCRWVQAFAGGSETAKGWWAQGVVFNLRTWGSAFDPKQTMQGYGTMQLKLFANNRCSAGQNPSNLNFSPSLFGGF